MRKKAAPKTSLRELTIRNLGVIDTAEIEFKSGLTVITGETGAGKTMVLTALNLILGGKSDSDFVRSGQERLVVSGKFEIGDAISAVVEDAGGFVEDNEVIINRSVTNQGKSKISLGGAVSSAAQVSEIAEDLIEIHAQASSARLSKSAVQLDLLDAFAGHEQLVAEYSENYEKHILLRKRIAELEKQLSIREVEIAKLEGIVKDFERIRPLPGEIATLDNEINKLGAVEELNSGIIEGLGTLNSEENSAMVALGISKKILDNLKGKDSVLDALIEDHSESIYELIEVTGKLERYLSQLEADPTRFDFLQNRKIEWASKLSADITKELALLAMPNAKLLVDVSENDMDNAKDYSATGVNEVSFLFTSHNDGKLLSIAKGASGGELSRVMLAVEVVLAKNSAVGTYIFDEVDAGVGGKAAVEVGKRLALLAKNSQVIVVTHLAQVASWADNHLVVTKSETGSVTQSNIIEVTGSERRREIARLLSGQDESISAQEHAGELLDMVAKATAEMIG